MSNSIKNFIGVAWPYVNGDLHPGHIAGCYLAADILARYKRLKGERVLMVSGSDCFGTPITLQAEKENKAPQEIVDYYSPRITDLLTNVYKISFDSFSKTATNFHKLIVQKFFNNLVKNGYIFKKETYQYFSEQIQKFLPDRYVEGTCKYCNSTDQRGDQCEICGRTLAVGDLINPRAKLTQTPVELRKTEHYFFNLPSFKKLLKKYVKNQKNKWRHWVWNESLAWIDSLEPRPITRDIEWGIPIPQDNIPYLLKLDKADSKRFYVWFDAVIGYFSECIKAYANLDDDQGEISDNVLQDVINEWWSPQDPKLVHWIFVGKDNLFFHTIWWPALLMGQENSFYGLELKLPDHVVVNNFLNLEGQKFSKSRGVYIDSVNLVSQYGLDAVRYYLTSIMPEESDANWQWKEFIDTFNNELVDILGNFIHRVISFAVNKLNLLLPLGSISTKFTVDKAFFYEYKGEKISICDLLMNKQNSVFTKVASCIESGKFKQALEEIMNLAKFGNIYLDRKAPWRTIGHSKEETLHTILNCIIIIQALRTIINPFLPSTSEKISLALGLLPLNSTKNLFQDKWQTDINEFKTIKLAKNSAPLFQKIKN